MCIINDIMRVSYSGWKEPLNPMSQKEGAKSSSSASALISSAAVSLKEVRFKPHSSICAVSYTPPNTHGESTGALYRPTLLDGQTLDIFMTSYHVLPIKKKEEVIDLVLDFYARSIRDVDVTAEWVEEVRSIYITL